MEFPVTIDSQEDFDKLIGPRLDRERSKFADYDDLKQRVDTITAEKASVEQERDAAITRADEAEAKVGEFESEKEIAQIRQDVAKTAGVPAAALRGSTKEELEAHAAELKPLLTVHNGPVIPNQGDTPEGSAKTSPWSQVLDSVNKQDPTT